jgi:ubiquinone/menaquinone biosynthesis C-methylase UbiE
MKLTWEQAVAYARDNPDMASLVELCYYDDPIEEAAARFIASEEWRAICSLLSPRPGAKILEIGAGRGIVSWAFAKSGCEVWALEPDSSDLVGSEAIRVLCQKTRQLITVVDALGEQLQFPDATFDYVVCRGVLHHVSNLRRTCAEAFRVLKPGGRFLAIKEHVADTPMELTVFLNTHPLHHLYGGEHAYPLASYMNSIVQAGFRRVRRYGQYDHPITSAPAATTSTIREMMERSLGSRLMPRLARGLSRSNLVLQAYRRWLTFRARHTPGRLYSFLAEKPS